MPRARSCSRRSAKKAMMTTVVFVGPGPLAHPNLRGGAPKSHSKPGKQPNTESSLSSAGLQGSSFLDSTVARASEHIPIYDEVIDDKALRAELRQLLSEHKSDHESLDESSIFVRKFIRQHPALTEGVRWTFENVAGYVFKSPNTYRLHEDPGVPGTYSLEVEVLDPFECHVDRVRAFSIVVVISSGIGDHETIDLYACNEGEGAPCDDFYVMHNDLCLRAEIDDRRMILEEPKFQFNLPTIFYHDKQAHKYAPLVSDGLKTNTGVSRDRKQLILNPVPARLQFQLREANVVGNFFKSISLSASETLLLAANSELQSDDAMEAVFECTVGTKDCAAPGIATHTELGCCSRKCSSGDRNSCPYTLDGEVSVLKFNANDESWK